jgi:hypothetical protein
MVKKVPTAVAIMLLAASTLPADFTYQETSTITGGMVASMMKVVGVFSKSAREPIRSTISVKGDRMMHRTANTGSIIDLSAQTITNIDFQKKTFSVMTFDEMKRMLDDAARKAKGKQDDKTQIEYKVSVDNTGKSQQIAGMDAKEMILKMEMQTTDKESGKSGTMTITSDMWVAPGVAGYAEVRDFYKRMSEKLNWTPGGNMFMQNPNVSEGMAGVYKEVAKLEGIPVLQTVVMGGVGQPGEQGGADAKPAQQQPAAERPSLGGALGSRLGLGGLGRKKSEPKKEEASAGSAPASTPGSLLEMKTELSNFSSNAVDASQFSVPAGFKKVDAKM